LSAINLALKTPANAVFIEQSTIATEAALPDIRTEALAQQTSVDLSPITAAFKTIDEQASSLGTRVVFIKKSEQIKLPSFGQIWLNLMNEETPDTVRKAVRHQQLFDENRKSLEGTIARNPQQIEQSLRAMSRFIENFLKDCIDAKESSFAGNRVKAREGLLEREDMKPFGNLLQACQNVLKQISAEQSR
jgi:hypothetical protein